MKLRSSQIQQDWQNFKMGKFDKNHKMVNIFKFNISQIDIMSKLSFKLDKFFKYNTIF